MTMNEKQRSSMEDKNQIKIFHFRLFELLTQIKIEFEVWK